MRRRDRFSDGGVHGSDVSLISVHRRRYYERVSRGPPAVRMRLQSGVGLACGRQQSQSRNDARRDAARRELSGKSLFIYTTLRDSTVTTQNRCRRCCCVVRHVQR